MSDSSTSKLLLTAEEEADVNERTRDIVLSNEARRRASGLRVPTQSHPIQNADCVPLVLTAQEEADVAENARGFVLASEARRRACGQGAELLVVSDRLQQSDYLVKLTNHFGRLFRGFRRVATCAADFVNKRIELFAVHKNSPSVVGLTTGMVDASTDTVGDAADTTGSPSGVSAGLKFSREPEVESTLCRCVEARRRYFDELVPNSSPAVLTRVGAVPGGLSAEVLPPKLAAPGGEGAAASSQTLRSTRPAPLSIEGDQS